MAIAQSRQVAGMITERTGRPAEIVGVMTLGDVSRAQLTQIGGTGVFVSALREALLAGEVDLAVHSLKDLPTGPAPGIVLAAVPPRDDPRDALAARDGAKLADLPAGARIGTSSPRRAAQLLALRGDLRCVPIRGNTDTRLGKVGSGEVNGVVLACAGLARLGCLHAVTQVFEPEEMLPAPGQGALAVECRDGEPELARPAPDAGRRHEHRRAPHAARVRHRGRRRRAPARPSPRGRAARAVSGPGLTGGDAVIRGGEGELRAQAGTRPGGDCEGRSGRRVPPRSPSGRPGHCRRPGWRRQRRRRGP